MKPSSYVLVGNGIAAVTATEILRAEDPSCSITVVADDPFPIYYRPALKDFLGGQMPEEKLWARPKTFYQEHQVRFIRERVQAIDVGQHAIQLQNQQYIGYHKLLIATGAQPRQLDCPGTELQGVKTLRSVADYQEILQLQLQRQSSRVVICGSGTLALESAETLNHLGFQVTHLLRKQTLWSEILDQTASDLVLQEERRAGIDVRLEENIQKIVGKNGRVSEVVTTRGNRLPCTLVLIAIGIEPAIDFAKNSGLACERGILVDDAMRTNAPDIYAAGDAIERVDPYSGQKRVIGQWYPAIQQARTAAYSMLDQQGDQVQSEIFYNATFLHGLDFVSLGLSPLPATLPDASYQEIIAEPQPRNYRKVLLKDGVPIGAALLGDRRDGLALKRAIDQRIDLSAVAHRLFKADFDLLAWLDRQPSVTDTQALQREEYDTYLVPLPHPQVTIQIDETLLAQQLNTIGRQSGSSLFIDHSSVSRKHAEIAWYNKQYYLCDIGSSNGTFVNNKRISPAQPVVLAANDLLRIGDVQFLLELRPRQSMSTTTQLSAFRPNNEPLIQATTQLKSMSPRIPEDQPCLIQLSSQEDPRIIPLEYGTQQSKRLSIGRDPDNDLPFDDSATSRRHAEVLYVLNEFYIRDLNSSNGVIVNKIKIHDVQRLHDGDRIVIGNILLYCSFSASTRHTFDQAEPTATQRLSTTRILDTQAPNLTNLVNLTHRSNIQPYSPEKVRLEVDMCIGCDRCMNACPLPSSSQVFIADLNEATISNKLLPHVERFTHECIMCGSCVPVCPVDNHRDLLMLSLKQRLGASWESPVAPERLPSELPIGWTLDLVVERLREQALFADSEIIPNSYLLHILSSSQLRQYNVGERMMREGEYARDLYFVLDGHLLVSISEADGIQLQLAVLNRGEYTGDYGMLTGQPQSNSADAQVPVVALKVPEQVMQRLMELVPQARQFFEQRSHERSTEGILRRMALFQGVADTDLRALAIQTQMKQYERDERLFAENDRGVRPARETLHLLLEGFVKVARLTKAGTGREHSNERVIAYRQAGDYFAGGLDLLGDGRAVTVSAINRTRVAEVPRTALLTLFQRYPEVDQRFRIRLRDYIESNASTQNLLSEATDVLAESPVLGQFHEGLHSLVSDGVVEGTEVLVIDLDKCIHCNECEEACERRHGHSRMNRKGMVVDNISIATACRQCQDPVCLLCSRAGIARRPNGEVYITESCIGCGICAERCPYGAISIVNIEEERVELPLGTSQASWQSFSRFFQKSPLKPRARKALPMVNGSAIVASGPLDRSQAEDPIEAIRKKIAIKCDLCAGYGDQACVQACPTGAAIRVQPTRFFGSTEEILRKRSV